MSTPPPPIPPTPGRRGRPSLRIDPVPGQDGRPRGPEAIRDIVGKLFASRGWGRKSERVRLETVWAGVIGPADSAQTRVLALKRGVLEVEVSSSVLMQELVQFRKRELLAALRAALPGVTISDLRFRPGAWNNTP